jgi:urease accessory protein
MLRAIAVVRQLAVKPQAVADTITLDHEGRHRRRVALTGAKGTVFLLDLEKAVAVKGGDAFRLEDGRLIQVVAAPQALLEIRAETQTRLARIAWHIGNRHTPAEITGDAIYIEADHVLAEMVRGLGGAVTKVQRAFEPERGAYEGHAHGGHGHHGHAHDETPVRDQLHIAAAAHDHDHDHAEHACGCGHDHGDHAHGHDDHHNHNHHGHDHTHTHAPAKPTSGRS